MTTTLALAGLVIGYALAAVFVCMELNDGPHWWCPLCAVLRLFAKRLLP